MQPQEQLTPAEYLLLLELVYSQRNPLFWQDIKAKLMLLSAESKPTVSNSLTTGDRETYGGGSKPSNIQAAPKWDLNND